jgi:hypothetical protein
MRIRQWMIPYLPPAIAALVLGGTRILNGSGTFLSTIAGVTLITLLQSILSVVQMLGLAEESFTELSSLRRCCCTGGSTLNKEMEKDKRMRAVVGRVGPAAAGPPGRERSWTSGGGRALPETDWWV